MTKKRNPLVNLGENFGVIKPPGDASWNWHYRRYRIRALDSSIDFDLTLEQFRSIAENNCTYCGDGPKIKNRYRSENKHYTEETLLRADILANGIDRVDNDKGYILANCVPCCTACNLMKSNHTKQKFLLQISKIFNFIFQKETE